MVVNGNISEKKYFQNEKQKLEQKTFEIEYKKTTILFFWI